MDGWTGPQLPGKSGDFAFSVWKSTVKPHSFTRRTKHYPSHQKKKKLDEKKNTGTTTPKRTLIEAGRFIGI